jgi:excisionase family DNA binding protein
MPTYDELSQRWVISIPELARLLGATEIAVRRRIEKGEIPARRWGRRIVLLREECEQFVRALPRLVPAIEELDEDEPQVEAEEDSDER